MPSSRYQEMQSRLIELRTRLLPKRFDPTGTYPPEQTDLTRAYRLLCHAEIEACLEDLALEAVAKTCAAWETSRKLSHCVLSLVAYYTSGPVDAGIGPAPAGKPAKELGDLIRDAKKAYSHYVRVDNHGVRAKNVRRLLFPAGVREADIGSTWLNSIDSFAAGRGETAHSAAKRTVVIPDPKTEYSAVSDITQGMRKIDALLVALAR